MCAPLFSMTPPSIMPEGRHSVRRALLIVAPLLLAAVLRGWNLLAFPVFLDEAIHIGWAMDTLHGDRLAGAHDGKWLSIKLMASFVALPLEPLLAARLLSVAAAVVTTACIIAIGTRLFSLSAGIAAGCVYAVLPFVVFPDRMALADGIQSMFVSLALLASILYAQTAQWRWIPVISALLTTALLAKISALVFVALPVWVVLTLVPRVRLPRHVLGAFATLVVPLLVFRYLAARGFAWQLGEKTQARGRSVIATMHDNLGNVLHWLWLMLTPPVCVLAAATLLWLLVVRPTRAGWLLAGIFGITVGPYIASAGILYPRYLHFAATPIALLAGAGLWKLGQWIADRPRRVFINHLEYAYGPSLLTAALLGAVLVWPLRTDVIIATAPERAALPPVDHAQYISAWPAGYGTREMARFLAGAGKARCGANVIRLHYWDHPLQGLDLYLRSSSDLNVVRLYDWQLTSHGLDKLLLAPGDLRIYTFDPNQVGWIEHVEEIAAQRPTYIALNPQRDAKTHARLVELFRGAPRVFVFPRPGTTAGLEVWQVTRLNPVAPSDGMRCDSATIEWLTQPAAP